MITTRDIKVDLSTGRRPLKQKTINKITRTIDGEEKIIQEGVDVYVKPGKPQPTKIVASTHTIEDIVNTAKKICQNELSEAMVERGSRQVIMTDQKAAEIMSATVEEGKATIETLASTMKEVKEKKTNKEQKAKVKKKKK